jgi:inorganic pyrophosphatase
VPVDKLTTLYSNIKTQQDLPPSLLNQISHFFEHYKDLEPGKFVKVQGWVGLDEARSEIMSGVATYQAAKDKPAY